MDKVLKSKKRLKGKFKTRYPSIEELKNMDSFELLVYLMSISREKRVRILSKQFKNENVELEKKGLQ